MSIEAIEKLRNMCWINMHKFKNIVKNAIEIILNHNIKSVFKKLFTLLKVFFHLLFKIRFNILKLFRELFYVLIKMKGFIAPLKINTIKRIQLNKFKRNIQSALLNKIFENKGHTKETWTCVECKTILLI